MKTRILILLSAVVYSVAFGQSSLPPPTKLSQLRGDVDTISSAPTNGQLLKWNGSKWVNATVSSSTIATDPIWSSLGDTVYGSGSGTGLKLSGNTTTTRKFLRETGNGSASSAPVWDTLLSGDIPDLSSIYQPFDSDLTTWAGITPGTGVGTALAINVGTAGSFVTNGGALGTPSSGSAANLTSFPTLNQNTTGSAASLSISGQTGLLTFTGLTSTNRAKTVRDAADTILELGTVSPTVTSGWTFSGGVTVSGSAITLSGNQSAAAWTTSGLRIKGVSGTLTDTTSSGTVAAAYTDKLGGNTIAATNATTFTEYASLKLSAPVQGTNVTITNAYALDADSATIGTSTPVTISSTGALTATSPALTTPKITTGINDANGNSMLAFTATASAVDGFTFTNAATANPATVTMAATGSDSNIHLRLVPKGTGSVFVGANSGSGFELNAAGAGTFSGQSLSISSATFTVGGVLFVENSGNYAIRNWVSGQYGWSSANPASSAANDTGLNRNAAGVVEINNGTPGTFRDLKHRKEMGVQTPAGTVAGTYSLDVTVGRSWTMTTTASTNLTITPTAAGTADQEITLIITSDATGGDVITFASPFKPSGTMTLTASKVHTIRFISDGTNLYELCRTTGL